MNFKDFSRWLVKFTTFSRLYEPCNNPALDEKKNVWTSQVVWIIELVMPTYHTLIHACGASHLWLIYVYAFNWSSLVLLGKNCKGLALYDTRMSFVTEWSSHCIYMIKSNGSAKGILSCVVFMRGRICMRHSPQTTWFAIFKPEQGSFSVYRIPK